LQVEVQVNTALAQAGQKLIASLHSSVILDNLCRVSGETLECDHSSVYLLQPEENTYTPAARWGRGGKVQETWPLWQFPASAMARLRERLENEELVQAGEEDLFQLSPVLAEAYRALGVSFGVFIALRRAGEFMGIQTAWYRGRQEPLTPAQERIGRGIAQLASFALENARLFAQAESANRLKSELLATMAHELRTPLHIILGYSDILLEGAEGALSQEQLRLLQRVQKNARDLRELIGTILDVNRLEAGRMPMDVSSVNICDLLEEIEAETRDLLGRKPSLKFHWRVVNGLPLLWTDRAKLKIILKNLINNAIKFTDNGSVAVEASAKDQQMDITVTDTGSGIASETQRVMFEMFRQGDVSSTRPYGGVGLGLYIVRRLLELLRGTVTVESEVGKGATFCVSLPLA
jgi:signal transduction histidine kinase